MTVSGSMARYAPPATTRRRRITMSIFKRGGFCEAEEPDGDG
jgi:hypothetical protein